MKKWLTVRSAELLAALNQTPGTDDGDKIKLKLLNEAMREVSVEMFHRAAENSRRDIEKITDASLNGAIDEAIDVVNKDEKKEKPEPKIKLSSSAIRRVDPY